MQTISLLWPNETHPYHTLMDCVAQDLGLETLLEEVFVQEDRRAFAAKCLNEMPSELSVIAYRQEVFSELYENKEFRKEMKTALDKLREYEMSQVRYRAADKKSSLMQLLERLGELRLYIEVILTMQSCFQKTTLHSAGFLRIRELVEGICKERGFQELRADIKELQEQMSCYRSITLGLNLDELWNVNEVIFVSLNEQRHKKNLPLLKRFSHFMVDAVAMGQGIEDGHVFTSKSGGQQGKDPIMRHLEPMMEKEVKGLTEKLWEMLRRYVDRSGDALTQLIPELEFYLSFANFFERLKEAGKEITMPKLQAEPLHRLQIQGGYNLRLFLRADGCDTQVANDFCLDKNGEQYILTGPNSGGKTTYTQAVGACVLLAQAGLAVPAQAYEGMIFDQIFTHFPASEEETVHYGRLGEEARRIHEIMQSATERSMLLLNETYSSTSFSEGLFLAKDLMRALKYRRIAVIYNTHLHELAECIGELNEAEGDGRIDSLVMGVRADGTRSYQVLRQKPQPNSFAKDIAQKYGVTYEMLKKGL